MGIHDREYMRERPGHGGRPFMPAASGWASWLLPFATMAIVGLCVFTAFKRWMPTRQATPPAVTAPDMQTRDEEAAAPARRVPRDPFPDDPTWSTARRPTQVPPSGEQRTVYRCVIGGVTTWSDQPGCPQAAAVVLDHPPPPTPSAMHPPGMPPPPSRHQNVPSVTPAPGANLQAAATPYRDKSLQCIGIAEEIKHVEALARQPQVASVQDELSQRKRDLQKDGFFLHCNL